MLPSSTTIAATPAAACLARSRKGGKHAVRKGPSPRGGVLGWPDVLRVLQRDEARSSALGAYRTAGHTPDDFARSRSARAAMADALTRVEDAMETTQRGSSGEREAIRTVRRGIEGEVWP